jgi:HEAT repeat protein
MKRLVFLGCRSAAVALSLMSVQHPVQAQVPDVVTRQWLTQTFLMPHAHDDATKVAATQAKWAAVRDRPETVSLLIEINEDTEELPLVRKNALLSMGATGQPRAYEYLAQRWSRTTPNDSERYFLIVALGSGPRDREREHSALALQKLKEILDGREQRLQIHAAQSLGDIGSARSRAILEERLTLERDPAILSTINLELKKPRR